MAMVLRNFFLFNMCSCVLWLFNAEAVGNASRGSRERFAGVRLGFRFSSYRMQ